MMTSNNALIPDPDKEDILASKPFDWPFLRLGLRMCGWGDTQAKYYLLGTPIIWWGGSLSLILGVASLVVYLMRMQRKYVDMDQSEYMRTFMAQRGADDCAQGNGTTTSMSARSRSWAGSCISVSFDACHISLR